MYEGMVMAAYCLQSENLKRKKEQGKGTADHILTLVDWFNQSRSLLKTVLTSKAKVRDGLESPQLR